MNIPNTVKIGAAQYSVVLEPETFSQIGSEGKAKYDKDNLGEHIPGLRRIRVAVSDFGEPMPEEAISDSFLHEVIHGIGCVYGLGLTEQQVMGLSGGLMQVIRDNNLDFRATK